MFTSAESNDDKYDLRQLALRAELHEDRYFLRA